MRRLLPGQRGLCGDGPADEAVHQLAVPGGGAGSFALRDLSGLLPARPDYRGRVRKAAAGAGVDLF